MFIRKKKVQGNSYYYLVNATKRKQKEMYLGKDLPVDLIPFYKKRKKK